jgi:hypothetical protein
MSSAKEAIEKADDLVAFPLCIDNFFGRQPYFAGHLGHHALIEVAITKKLAHP